MNRKSLLGLILFAVLITSGLFIGADYLAGQNKAGNVNEQSVTNDNSTITQAPASEQVAQTTTEPTTQAEAEITQPVVTEEPWLSSNPSDTGVAVVATVTVTSTPEPTQKPEETPETTEASASTSSAPELIYDSKDIDFMSFIPKTVTDSELKAALDIKNPSIDIAAEAAILFDADTKKVLYDKNPVEIRFPASTAKLLTSIVALQWCKEDEQVTIGDEINMIASDSTKADLKKGEILTIHNLLEGMLLPSGNDAAYAIAAYVGRKSLGDKNASKEEAITEFTRLMNKEADKLGVKNSCFKTPDGYDAVGQYTTAYDMGLIGIEAAKNETITDICHKSKSRNVFVSGEDVTWSSTDKLITRYSGQYYSHAIGLKTGTSTMAGRCLIAAAEYNNKKVVCVIMDSTSEGRWEDAIALLKYGLN